MKLTKKLFLASSFIIVPAMLFSLAAPASAAFNWQDLLAQISSLKAKILALEEQLSRMQNNGSTQATWCFTFDRNLKFGNNGNDVRQLKTALTKEGLYSNNSSSNSFDEFVASAVVQFQEKYASEILTPYGLSHGTGYVGPSTRTKLNKLYGCNIIYPSSLNVVSPNGGERWIKNNRYVISWNQSNLSDSDTVAIYLYGYNGQGGENAVYTVASGISAKSGTYSWLVPSNILSGTMYKIKVSVNGKSQSDLSDNYFSIADSASNLYPVISSVSGPVNITIGQSGTWAVNATDPENNPLTYSVLWGDEVTAYGAPLSPSAQERVFSQTATFTHVYANAGNYTITFYVKDNAGNTAVTTINITVTR